MLLRDVKRDCKHCGNPLRLRNSRDLERKQFCSCRCRQLWRWNQGNMVCPTKPKGIRHKWDRVFKCELCPTVVINGTPNQKWCEECVPSHTWSGRARRYGIGKKHWESMLEAQGYACALCPATPTAVDHDHTTGEVRGLLCMQCNIKLAVLDDAEWCAKAELYTRRA